MPWVNTGGVEDLHIFCITFQIYVAAKSLISGSTIMKLSIFEEIILYSVTSQYMNIHIVSH